MDDQDTNKQKLLRLIEGGKAPTPGNASNAPDKVPAGRVGLAESGLTLKQEAFVQELAKGSTNSDAYRASYNCDGMASSTVHQEASRLATNPKIAARLGAVLDRKGLENSVLPLKQASV